MSRASSTSYEIGKPRGLCAATGEPIRPGESFIAALVEPAPDPEAATPDEKLDRVDVAEHAWDDGFRPSRLFAYWRTVMKETAAEQNDGLDGSTLLELFDNLEGAEEPRRVAFRYVLALMLIRGRSLKQVGVLDDRPGLLVVRRGDPDEAAVEVDEPELDAAALAGVTEQVRTVMNMEG